MERKKEGTLVCKYCGRTGFFNVKSLSIHRRFSKSCLKAWKKEQEEIDNSKSKVKCAVCGEYLRNISNTHLRKHNMTQQEYKCKFPDAPIFSDGLLDLQKEKREATIVERYGDNKKKRTLSNFICQYGEEEGTKRWNKMMDKRSEYKQSKIAMELFDIIALKVQDKKIYFYDHPKEYGIMIKEDKTYCLLDFYCLDNNKVIEFYGDYWHANPNIYNENDIVFYPKNKNLLAKDIWEKDKSRIEKIQCQMNCQIMIVWESDFVNHKEETIKKVIDFLKS